MSVSVCVCVMLPCVSLAGDQWSGCVECQEVAV